MIVSSEGTFNGVTAQQWFEHWSKLVESAKQQFDRWETLVDQVEDIDSPEQEHAKRQWIEYQLASARSDAAFIHYRIAKYGFHPDDVFGVDRPLIGEV